MQFFFCRGERSRGINKLVSLSVYNEDDSNDLSDLGIGASSASGKSSLSEDYDIPCAMVSIYFMFTFLHRYSEMVASSL